MSGSVRSTARRVAAAVLLAGCATVTPPGSNGPRYVELATLGPGLQWRHAPVVADLDRDGKPDLIATARLGRPSLRMWRGDGQGGLVPIQPTWSDLGFGAVAVGDVNHDGIPDVIVALHNRGIQTLLGDGRGGFTEKTLMQTGDGYAGAALADVDGDGHVDLVVVGETQGGLEIYRGDGAGNWTLHAKLPEQRFGPFLVGRALGVADLNHDGHADIVVAFQLAQERPGLYAYYGDGRGGFTGGPIFEMPLGADVASLTLADVNGDGHVDIVLNGVRPRSADAQWGPDVYLGDGRGGWKVASGDLKVFKTSAGGVAVGNVDGRGPGIVAGGALGAQAEGLFGVFLFRPDASGAFRLVADSGLPAKGLSSPEGIALADLDGDGRPEVIVLSSKFLSTPGSITIWKEGAGRLASRTPGR